MKCWTGEESIQWQGDGSFQCQDDTNSGSRVARATKFRAVELNVFGPSVWNFLRKEILAPRVLRYLLGFWKIHAPQVQTVEE